MAEVKLSNDPSHERKGARGSRLPLRRKETNWGICWEGTPEQLVSAGVVDAETLMWALRWRRGDGGAFRRPTLSLPSGRQCEVYRCGAYRASIREHCSNDEVLNRSRLASQTTELARARRDLGDLPTSTTQGKQSLLSCADGFIAGLRSFLARGFGGYHVSKESMEDIEGTSVALLEAIERSHVVLDLDRRAAALADIHNRIITVQGNAEFQRFLKLVVRPDTTK